MQQLKRARIGNGRNVKGSVFRDYVRMIKKNKHVDWGGYLMPGDMDYIGYRTITAFEWYPFEVFQRFGDAVFREIAKSDPDVAKAWGRKAMDDMAQLYRENLVVKGDQLKTVKKFLDMQNYLFDFKGFELSEVSKDRVDIKLDRAFAENGIEGYTHQMLGSFERLLELSGAVRYRVKISRKAWEIPPQTIIELRWMNGN